MDKAAFFRRIREGRVADVRAALDEEPAWARATWSIQDDGNTWAHGTSALHVAVLSGCVDVVDLLLDHGADPEARSHEGPTSRTPLHDSYEHGQEAITQRLLARGAIQDISVAAARGDFARVETLLADDPSLVNDPSNGLSPLGWAGYGRDPKMVPFLLERGARLEGEIGCPASTANVAILQEFLAAGADPNELLAGWSARPLHVVASLRYAHDAVPAARLLIDAGADVNGRAADGVTTALDVATFGLRLRGASDERLQAGFESLLAFLRERGGVHGRA